MPKYIFKSHYADLINHIFQTLLITYLTLLLIEQVYPNFVSQYLNLNYLLIIVIIIGILDVFSEHPEKKEKPKVKWFDYVFITALGILGFAIIRFKTATALDSWLSWVISIIAGILIILLSILVLDENGDEDKSKHKDKKQIKITHSLWIYSIIGIILILNLISFLLFVFSSLNYLESLRIVFGSVYVLFLPGFILTFLFFPKLKTSEEDKGIDWLERIALSFALSIAVVPLAVFYLNLIGIKINLLNSSLIILGIIILSSIGVYYRVNYKKN